MVKLLSQQYAALQKQSDETIESRNGLLRKGNEENKRLKGEVQELRERLRSLATRETLTLLPSSKSINEQHLEQQVEQLQHALKSEQEKTKRKIVTVQQKYQAEYQARLAEREREWKLGASSSSSSSTSPSAFTVVDGTDFKKLNARLISDLKSTREKLKSAQAELTRAKETETAQTRASFMISKYREELAAKVEAKEDAEARLAAAGLEIDEIQERAKESSEEFQRTISSLKNKVKTSERRRKEAESSLRDARAEMQVRRAETSAMQEQLREVEKDVVELRGMKEQVQVAFDRASAAEQNFASAVERCTRLEGALSESEARYA